MIDDFFLRVGETTITSVVTSFPLQHVLTTDWQVVKFPVYEFWNTPRGVGTSVGMEASVPVVFTLVERVGQAWLYTKFVHIICMDLQLLRILIKGSRNSEFSRFDEFRILAAVGGAVWTGASGSLNNCARVIWFVLRLSQVLDSMGLGTVYAKFSANSILSHKIQ